MSSVIKSIIDFVFEEEAIQATEVPLEKDNMTLDSSYPIKDKIYPISLFSNPIWASEEEKEEKIGPIRPIEGEVLVMETKEVRWVRLYGRLVFYRARKFTVIRILDGIDLHNFSALYQLKIQRFTENLTSVQYVGNILHLFVNIYFNYGIMKTSLMHPNMKILVITISSQYSVIALGRIGETLNSKVFPDKAIVVTNTICIFFKILTDTALITSCTSMLLIGVERVLTMVYRKSSIDTNGILGFTMLVSMILFGIVFSMSSLLYDIFIAETFDIFHTETSCQNLYTHPLILPMCWCFAAITFVIGVALLYYVYRHNKMMLKKHLNDPLTIRYQYATSIETLRALLPAVAGYGVMVLIGVIFSFYSVYAILSTNQNSFDVQISFQLLYMIADFYGIYFVVYFFIRFRPMKKRLRNHLRLIFMLPQNVVNTIKPIDTADAVQQTNEYFDQLTNVWNLNANEIQWKGREMEKKKKKKEKKKQKNMKIETNKKKVMPEERSNTI